MKEVIKISKLKLNYAFPVSDLVKEQLEFFAMPQKELALRLGMSEKHISQFLNNKVNLTLEMANGLERVFVIPVDVWMKYDINYRNFVYEKQKLNDLNNYDLNEINNNFQVEFLVKESILDVDKDSSLVEQTNALLQFMGVKDIDAFYKVYNNKFLNNDINISELNMEALAIWIRTCEKSFNFGEFDSVVNNLKLKKISTDLDKIVNFKGQLDECGVWFDIINDIPNCKAKGMVIWLKNNPGIFINSKYKENINDHGLIDNLINYILNSKSKNMYLEIEKTQ